jgi:CubicO group peptidase (beta-lactamase class C family)
MTTTASALAGRVRDAIRDTVSTFTLPGVQVAWCCDGIADEVAGGTTTPGARIPIGSATKAFTASLAMQLVSDGALELDDPVLELLPPGPCRDVLGDVTLRQLLTHTSGLEDDPVAAEGPCGSPSRYVGACTRELLFPPGRHFSYANAGYVVVGHLVERAMEQSWTEGVRSFLLDPLDARGTFFLSERPEPGEVAGGHVRRPDGAIDALPGPSRLGREWAPTCGLALSAADLLRLVRLHLDDGRSPHGFSLLDAGVVREMRQPAVAVPDPGFADAWGLGWTLLGGWFGHDGDDEGWTARVRADAETGFAIVMLASCLPADREWRALLGALRPLGLDVGEPAVPWPPRRAEPIDPGVAGRYENGVMRLSVVQRDDGFWLDGGEQRVPLQSLGGDRCLAVPAEHHEAPFVIAFLRDGDGHVGYVNHLGRVARRVAA